MKRYLRTILLIFATICSFSSCEENMDTEDEYVNWTEKNAEAFQKVLNKAHQAIAQAKDVYGNEWEEHCEWRAFRAYTQATDVAGKATDSICVKVINLGSGSGCPEYTDSVRVNYVGRLMPSPSYPEGFVFDQSGKGSPVEDVFRPEFAHPAMLLVANTVVGFTTVLQQMHIGDRWLVYIPSELGYGSISNPYIPGGSMLTFDLQLTGYYRPGFSPNN